MSPRDRGATCSPNNACLAQSRTCSPGPAVRTWALPAVIVLHAAGIGAIAATKPTVRGQGFAGRRASLTLGRSWFALGRGGRQWRRFRRWPTGPFRAGLGHYRGRLAPRLRLCHGELPAREYQVEAGLIAPSLNRQASALGDSSEDHFVGAIAVLQCRAEVV